MRALLSAALLQKATTLSIMFVREKRVCVDTEVSSASGAEEEAGGEVRDGRPHRSAAHLHRLVSPALHVVDQICGWSRQQAAGRFSDHHTWRLPGDAQHTCTV